MPEDERAENSSAPSWGQSNMRPTLNGTGFMFEVIDEFADEFRQYAAASDAPVAEVGCAFGVATLPALAAGAKVVACDLAQEHLDIIVESAPVDQRARLRCVQGELPYLDRFQAAAQAGFHRDHRSRIRRAAGRVVERSLLSLWLFCVTRPV